MIVGRISPAAVSIEKVSESVQPRRRRYMIASRAPLPDSSASEPSGLKMRRWATKPRFSGCESSSRPSDPSPLCGAQMRRIALRRQLERQLVALDDHVVVPQRVPLLESQTGAHDIAHGGSALQE